MISSCRPLPRGNSKNWPPIKFNLRSQTKLYVTNVETNAHPSSTPNRVSRSNVFVSLYHSFDCFAVHSTLSPTRCVNIIPTGSRKPVPISNNNNRTRSIGISDVICFVQSCGASRCRRAYVVMISY